MKSVGSYLKEYRLKRKMSVEDVSLHTKIRLDYLEAIELNKFEKLPSAAFVKGFIRNYSVAVGLEPEKALAIFRRDFDQNEKGKVVHRGFAKPIQSGKGFWSPRTTSLFFGSILLLLTILYGSYQVFTLTSAPSLSIESPIQNQSFVTQNVPVAGQTRSEATVLVNNQSIPVDSNGYFETNLNLNPGEHTLLIETQSRDGKTRSQSVVVFVEEVGE